MGKSRSVQLPLGVGRRAAAVARRWEGSLGPGEGYDVSKKEFSECQPSQ